MQTTEQLEQEAVGRSLARDIIDEIRHGRIREQTTSAAHPSDNARGYSGISAMDGGRITTAASGPFRSDAAPQTSKGHPALRIGSNTVVGALALAAVAFIADKKLEWALGFGVGLAVSAIT